MVVMNVIRDMNPNSGLHIYEVYAYNKVYQFASFDKALDFYNRAKADEGVAA